MPNWLSLFDTALSGLGALARDPEIVAQTRDARARFWKNRSKKNRRKAKAAKEAWKSKKAKRLDERATRQHDRSESLRKDAERIREGQSHGRD